MAVAVGSSAASVASLYVISSTRDSRPRTSQSSCPSLRFESDIRPASFICHDQRGVTGHGTERHTSSTPIIHSSTVSSFSRAKSCRCWIKLEVSCLTRGVAFGPVAAMTCCVKLGLNLCALLSCTAASGIVSDMMIQSKS